jgi:hypothetical protein
LKSRSSERLELELGYGGGLGASLIIEKAGGGSFRFLWKPVESGSVAYFRLRLVADPTEGFYGLGGVLDGVNQRGKRRAMQTELDLELESGNNEAHIPVPLLLGTRGWAIFVDSYLPGMFEVAAERPEVIEITYGTGTFSEEGLVFYLFSAPHPLDLLKPYYEVTGYPKPPAPLGARALAVAGRKRQPAAGRRRRQHHAPAGSSRFGHLDRPALRFGGQQFRFRSGKISRPDGHDKRDP